MRGGGGGSGAVSSARAIAVVALGLAGVAGACFLSVRGVEPVATWLYPAAWYSLLLALEGGVALRHGRFLLLGRPRALLSVLAWSVPIWMAFEVLNVRLDNWHYVFVPDRRAALWAGVTLSFATVVPACLLPAALVYAGGRRASPVSSRVGDGGRRGGGLPGRKLLVAVRICGLAFLVLPPLWPRWFFPLVWGAVALLAEPDVARKAPERSLLVDVTSGRLSRPGALLAGGAVAGLCWEALNAVARAGWIYTVPGLEEFKLFEMPLLGFLGFPPLAITVFSLCQWLALRGWSVPVGIVPADRPVGAADEGWREGGRAALAAGRSGGPARLAVAAGAVLFVVGTLLVIERETISSRTPRLRDLPGLLPGDVETLTAWRVGSVFALAEAEPADLAGRLPGVGPERARAWIESARLATTRGMGTRHARHLHGWGVRSPADLARTEPADLARCFASVPGADVPAARIRVWWRGARDATAGAPESGEPLRPACPGRG